MRKIHKRAYLALGALLAGAAANLAPSAAAPASAAIPSAVIAVGDSAFNSIAEKTATAVCPAGTHVISGGFSLNSDHVFIIRTEPISDANGDRIAVTAIEDETGTPNNWSVRAEATCTASQNVADFHINSQTSAPASTQFIGINSGCNSSATTALGTGMKTLGAGNQAHFTTQMPAVPSIGSFDGAFEDPNGFAGNWQVVSYTICAAQPFDDVRVVEVFPEPNSESPKKLEAVCPEGFRAIGGSGFANQFASIKTLQVTPGRLGVVLTGAEIVPTEAGWNFQLRAICVRI